MEQRGEDRAHRVRARTDVADAKLRKDRRPVRETRQIEHAGVSRADVIVAGTVGERAVPPERRDRTHDDTRIEFAHYFVAETDALDDAGREILYQHVDTRYQRLEDRQALRLLQIDAEAFLAAILLNVVGAAAVAQVRHAARKVAIRGDLDFDHLRAHLPQIARGGWSGERLREIEHSVAGEHQRLCCHRGSPPPGSPLIALGAAKDQAPHE